MAAVIDSFRAIVVVVAACVARGAPPVQPQPGADAASGTSVVAAQGSSGELVLRASDAVPRAWGRSLTGTVRSAVLHEERTVEIFLPSSFTKTKHAYPVIFLSDGEHYFEEAAVAARQLYLAGHIPDCIVVAIHTPERRQDLTPPGMPASLSDGREARGEKFLDFITEELRPQLVARVRAGSPSVLMGHSHGGLICHYAATKRRQDFPFIVALDAPVHLDDAHLARDLLESESAGGPLRLVSLEVKFGWNDGNWSRLVASAPPEWKLSRIKLAAEDHESMVFQGFYAGLKEVFEDYSQVRAKGLSPADAFRRYERLAPLYGGTCTPPEDVLRRALMHLTALGRADEARRALSELDAGYGDVDVAESEAEIAEAAAAMSGQETVEELLALPPPTEAQMAPYVGVWKGVTWVDADRKHPVVVTLAVEYGHGVAQIDRASAPPEFQHEVLRYLRVTGDGIEFGGLNGMFPPGIIAWVAKPRDGKLEGTCTFRGVYFKYPPGQTPPQHSFSLTKE